MQSLKKGIGPLEEELPPESVNTCELGFKPKSSVRTVNAFKSLNFEVVIMLSSFFYFLTSQTYKNETAVEEIASLTHHWPINQYTFSFQGLIAECYTPVPIYMPTTIRDFYSNYFQLLTDIEVSKYMSDSQNFSVMVVIQQFIQM